MVRVFTIQRSVQGALTLAGLALIGLTSCSSKGDSTAVASTGGFGGVGGGAVGFSGGGPGGGVPNGAGGFVGALPGSGGLGVGGGAAGIGGSALGGALGTGGFVGSGGAPGGGALGAGGNVAGGAPGSGGAPVLPPGTQQYTLVMDSFPVDPGAEFYKCQDLPNPFGADIAIVKTESTVSVGAHHMYAFQIPADQAAFNPPVAGQPALPFTPDGKKTPVFDCPGGGFEFHPYIHLSQRQNDVITYPDGIGRSLKSSEAIRFMVHYVNTGTAPITVGASVIVNYKKPTDVSQLAGGIFIFAPGLQVPTGASTKNFTYTASQDMSFLQMTGHMHRRGTHYEAHVRTAAGDNKLVYSSDTWQEAPTQNYSPALALKQGDFVDYACTYENDTGMTLTYGESAVSNEMCNLFGIFFPATDGNGIFGPVLGTN